MTVTGQRLVASVAIHDDHPPSRHFSGPPPEAGIEGAHQERMPWPRLVLAAERDDGVYLKRLLAVGDTAHDSIEEAKEQAAWEYGGFLGPWRPVPGTVPEELIPGYALGQ